MPDESRAGRGPKRRRLLSESLPEPKIVQEEVEKRTRAVLRAVANPSTLLAGVEAMTALRRAIEAGAKEGPHSPAVRVGIANAERAILTAVREAANALLIEMGPRAEVPAGRAAEGEGLIEVPVERDEAEDEQRPNPLRTTARVRPAPVKRRGAGRSGAKHGRAAVRSPPARS
jgi:hypothetical protein